MVDHNVMSPLPITGAALANCLGETTEAVFAEAVAGRQRFVDVAAFAPMPFAARVGMMSGLGSMALPEDVPTTRILQVAMASASQIAPAVRRAIGRWGAGRVGYVFASSTGGLSHTEDALLAPTPLPPTASLYEAHAMNATSEPIARFWGAEGYRYTVSTACSSSLKAIKSAMRIIAAGLADAMVVGCADSLCRTTLMGFHSLGIFSSQPTRPFSAARDGITIGEGSAYILVEREAPADETLCWLRGIGESSDAYHPSSPDPEGRGAIASMGGALAAAGLEGAALDYVLAHGTGTQQNDAMESVAIRALAPHVAVSATKALTGHTLGAAGLTALVLGIESLKQQTCLPTPGAAPLDSTLGVAVELAPTRRSIDHVLVNAFAFGGNNCSVVISRTGRMTGLAEDCR